MDFMGKGIEFYIGIFVALLVLPIFLQLVDTAVVTFNTTLVAINVSYLTLGNALITIVRLAPYGLVVAVIAGVVLWIKSSMGKKGF